MSADPRAEAAQLRESADAIDAGTQPRGMFPTWIMREMADRVEHEAETEERWAKWAKNPPHIDSDTVTIRAITPTDRKEQA